MRTLIAGPAGLVMIALSAAVAGSVTPGQAATRPTCLKRPGTTLRSNALVRVYETVPDTSEEGTLSRLWACQVGPTRRVERVDAYGREWALIFIAPLVVVLAFLCAIVARSAPSR